MLTVSALRSYWRRILSHQNAHNDQYAITPQRARCLAELISNPTGHTQRFVEELSFVATGGQQWTRTLQIRIPHSAEAIEPAWWIVSLGPFKRRRFPDLIVTDGAQNPIRLLTRAQHGQALTRAALAKPLHEIRKLDKQYRAELSPDGKAHQIYVRLKQHLTAFFTEISNTVDRIEKSKLLIDEYGQLLLTLNLSLPHIEQYRAELADTLIDLTDTTQYLCWVYAAPDETIHLQASHTVRDPKHRLEDGDVFGLLNALWTGTIGLRCVGQEERKDRIDVAISRSFPTARRWFRYLPLRIDGTARRKRQADWFRQYGLAPINYEFNVPTYRYTTSYYATLTPPVNAMMTCVDWELDDSFGKNSEVDCAFHSIHVYNPRDGAGRDKTFRTTRAYVRCSPHHHKQILIAAALNFVVVWLLVKGRLLGNSAGSLQELVIASPSIWVAFLAQQQRHYYAHALRRSRAILWAYLIVALTFLTAVASSDLDKASDNVKLSLGVKIFAWLLAVTSIGVLAWNAPLGHSYDRVVKYLRNRKFYAVWEPRKLGPVGAFINDLWWVRRQNKRIDAPWKCYEAAYEVYSRFIWRGAACSMLGAIAVLHFVLNLTPY